MLPHDLVTCRRVNYIQAAMVQAAISIREAHGIYTAVAVLEAEAVPTAVINRVLCHPPSRLRSNPYIALERPAALIAG